MADNKYRSPQPGPLGPKDPSADWNGATAVSPFTLKREDGTTYYLWIDSTGDLRIKSSAPASDTDGTVAGTQS